MPRIRFHALLAGLVFAGAVLLLPKSAVAAPAARAHVVINRMYVFGDSYSDIGEGYLDGNGPTSVAYLADRLAAGKCLWENILR